VSVATELAELIGRTAAVLHELGAADLDGLPDAELSDAVEAMQPLRGALEVAEARLIGRWEAQGSWRASGARSAAAWLAWRHHLPTGVAAQRVRHARALRDLPAVADAWAAGELDRTHVVTLLGTRNHRTAAAFDDQHKVLVDVARTESFRTFKAACDRFGLFADPDGVEQAAEEDRAARALHLAQSFDGMWFGKLTLDPVAGQIVADTLQAIEHELFEADWAAAKDRLGRDPLVIELDRTPAQRRADALAEMATRARAAPAGGRRPAPLFSVVVGYETFAGPVLELFNRTVLTPGTAARWLTQADIERVVFDGPSRVIDLGPQRRFYTGALRRAIEVRDRVCYHPTCDQPPDQPQIDHIVQAANGGPTTQANGRLACAFHNRWRNNHPDLCDDPDRPDDADPTEDRDRPDVPDPP
jgi:hypothetical protein